MLKFPPKIVTIFRSIIHLCQVDKKTFQRASGFRDFLPQDVTERIHKYLMARSMYNQECIPQRAKKYFVKYEINLLLY